MTHDEATALLRKLASYIDDGLQLRMSDASLMRQVAAWISAQSAADDARREQELSDLMKPMRVSGAGWHV